MRRKMLPEEKELRAWDHTVEPNGSKREFYADIRALVRAVREDCARVAESFYSPPSAGNPHSRGLQTCEKIAAAIQARR